MADLRTFDLNLLVAFNLLMQERSVSRAAEKMFISQPAMSHVLQRLRQQLEDPLLVKTPTGMVPTARALALVDPVAALLKEVEGLIKAPAPFEPGTSRRSFVIAATDYVEALLLPKLEKWSIVVYLSRFAQAAIFSMLSCTPSLNTTPSMT